jgi:hypothetical protein
MLLQVCQNVNVYGFDPPELVRAPLRTPAPGLSLSPLTLPHPPPQVPISVDRPYHYYDDEQPADTSALVRPNRPHPDTPLCVAP